MEKFIKYVLFFTFIILVFASVINFAVGRRNKEPAHYKLQYEELVNSKNACNFLILGTSHATHGIRPSFLNLPEMSVYNFALNGSNPEFYFNWYNEIFKKTYQKPEYIIFCFGWYIFEEQWLWRKYEQDAEYFPCYVFINNLINFKRFDTKILLLNRFPFIKHKKIADLLHIITNKPDMVMPVCDYDRGFIPSENNGPYKLKSTEIRISLKQKKYFEKLIGMLVNDGIKLIFVSVPEYDIHYSDSQLKSFDICKKNANKFSIPILNYNIEKRSDLNQQRKYFSDWGHLNSKGSIEFSKVLNRDLSKVLLVENVH